MTGWSTCFANGPIDGRSVFVPGEDTLKNSSQQMLVCLLFLKKSKKDMNFSITPHIVNVLIFFANSF